MFNFLKNILIPLKIFNDINKVNAVKPKFVFYSENKSYQKYAYPLIEFLTKKYPSKIYYVSSDEKDIIDNRNIINIFVGKSFFLQYFFKSIFADNFFIK